MRQYWVAGRNPDDGEIHAMTGHVLGKYLVDHPVTCNDRDISRIRTQFAERVAQSRRDVGLPLLDRADEVRARVVELCRACGLKACRRVADPVSIAAIDRVYPMTAWFSALPPCRSRRHRAEDQGTRCCDA